MGNKRIALNVFFTVAQSVFAVACGLLSGRWIIGALGDDGFGVFSVVGCLMSFILFLNGVLVSSASRHLASAIGEAYGMPPEAGIAYVGKWFSASFYVHLVLPLVLCGVGFFVGEWYVGSKLVVPEAIRGQCHWVMRFSLVSAFVSIVSAPFAAMYTARQFIFVRTAFSIGTTILSTAGAYLLFYFDANRIFYHALITTSIQLLFTVAIVVFGLLTFPECRRIFGGTHWRHVRDLLSFGGSTMLEMFGNMVRNQGVAVVVNRFCGVATNASMGIASQVTSKTIILGVAINGAMSPETTTCLSSGRKSRAFNLSNKVNLFVPMSFLLMAAPLLANIEYILKVWLVNPPESAATFCFIALTGLYVTAMTDGYQQIINANGKIFACELSLGLLLASSVVIAAVLFSMGATGAVAVGAGMIAPTLGIAFVRLFFMKRIFGVGPKHWIVSCLFPNVVLVIGLVGTMLALARIMQDGWVRCIVSGLLSILVFFLTVMFVMTKDDRDFVFSAIGSARRSLFKK